MAFTKEQLASIEASGKTIVSASAGSGKTTVMIEKIIRLIKSGADVGEILAVTFTKKAASQMKEKLCKALIAAINDPETTSEKRTTLKKQLVEVPTADISTIHSFCSRLLRTNFYKAGVDNAFRVIGGDDAESTALKNEALDELFDEAYEEKDEDFLHLLSTYWRKKSDNTLRKIFLTTYEELRNRADYRDYLQASGVYSEATFDCICADLLEALKEKCGYYLPAVQEQKQFFETNGSDGQKALVGELENALEALRVASDYFAACGQEKPKFTIVRSSKKDDDKKKKRLAVLSAIKSKIGKIYDELLETKSREEELKNFLVSGKTARAVAKYLLQFDEKYEALKRERGVLDYNDLEHKALALLKDEEVQKETREKYRYVFVDEYQDVNPVQEAIVSAIGGDNLFLVGDVKQSIYGFRGSKSKFFVEKQRQFESGEGNSLHMTNNFRSSDAVLDLVNSQFSLAMTKRTSSVDYATDSYMERGGRYALNDGRVQIHFLKEDEKEERGQRGVYSVKANAEKRETKESATAKTIRYIIEQERGKTWYDPDRGEYRQVQYSDIAVLSRKKQGQIAQTVASLAAEGVPVTSVSAVNICDYAEIKTLIDILSLIDNAEQDVPLCSALISPMGNLTANDLAQIRLAYPKEKFFRTACQRYAFEREEKGDLLVHRLRSFYKYYEELRDLSCVMDAGEILTKILLDTRMEARLLSRENGGMCMRRIHRFIEEAGMAETPSVHAFLQHLKDLDYKIECNENGGEDSVKVLTMHSSKGLEYPVVIMDNLNAPFRGVDKNEVLVEEKYGLAPKAFDTEKMLKSETLLRRLHEKRESESSVADELNLFYVALTRAKYALHLVLKERSVVPDVRYARSFADFADFSVWEKYVVEDEIFDLPKQERDAIVFRPDEELVQKIMRSFTWSYAFSGFENLPVKSSATEIISGQESKVLAWDERETQENEAEIAWEGKALRAETSVEKGLAYHAFLEKFDFSLLYRANGERVSREELDEIVQEEFEKLGDPLLSAQKLVEILSNPVFFELKDMRLYKEQQFLVSLPVRDTYAKKVGMENLKDAPKGEEMLFQGAIDLLAVGENEVRIIDYKYSVRDSQSIKEHYRLQLRLYKQAAAKILNVPKEKVRCTIVNIYRGYQVDVDE